MTHWPHISLVLCTRNRSDQLRSSLTYLGKISYPPDRWELIIVDNGSTDATGEVVSEFARRNRFRVTHVCEPAAGLGRARNTGVQVASGEIIAFTDDDCYPAQNFLESIARAFERDDLDFLGGRIELYSPEDAAVTITTGQPERSFEAGRLIPPGAIHGANMAFRRDVFRRIGGFNVLMGAGTRFAAEDLEFLTRASLAGFRGAYIHGPCVWHHHGRKWADVPGLHRRHDWGLGAYYASLLLSGNYRGVARAWAGSTYRRLRKWNLTSPLVEIVSGTLYLAVHVAHGPPWPRFPTSW